MGRIWELLAVAAMSSGFVNLTIQVAWERRFGMDSFLKIQGVHNRLTPRLGGLGIVAAFSLTGVVLLVTCRCYTDDIARFWIVSAPVFLIGLAEDLTGRISARIRLVVTAVSAALGMVLLGAIVPRIDVPLIDHWLLSATAVSAVFTLVAVTGVPHALNIIDGCNGLAASTGLCGLAAIGAVAAGVHDDFVLTQSLVAAAAVAGFLIWNFPYGRIFLGDAGSYWLGFTLAELSVLLVARHPQVSSWFPMLLVMYPVWETLFSSTRRMRTRGFGAIAQPDTRHLHHLVYRRLMLPALRGAGSRQRLFANSATTLPFVAWSGVAAVLGSLFWNQPWALFGACAVFALIYLRAYRYLAGYRPRRTALPRRVASATIPVSQHVVRSPGRAGATHSAGGGLIPALLESRDDAVAQEL